MRIVQEIEGAIEQLPRSEMGKLANWLPSKFAVKWDNQIEEEINAGRLDHLARQAITEFREGVRRKD